MGIATSVDWFEKAHPTVAPAVPGSGTAGETVAGAVVSDETVPRAEEPPDRALKSALTAVSAYVPSEALAVYLALLAILNPDDAPAFKGLLFALGLGLVCLFMLASFAAWKDLEPPELVRRIVLLAFALVAFWLWAGAMPSGPFAGPVKILDFSTDATVLYGAGVIVAAAVFPIAAKSFGLRPR